MENLKLQNVDFKHLLLKKINLTLKLETSAVSGFLFRTSVAMTRASVTRERVVHFPLTQIGNTSYRNITLVNPFERHTLKVQLVLEKHYPYSNTIISEIPDRNITLVNSFERHTLKVQLVLGKQISVFEHDYQRNTGQVSFGKWMNITCWEPKNIWFEHHTASY
ncbi:uncharacterized protein LOC113472134 [Diaphorina citri]|uniref:Uncharacterized protein LOC113472134 n=1 Tax=Diaphorina citri TaxID=121845 RepID=A0A3Q0JGI0_DIACI|nr:uncharacterized protein LOC113472134 [Diaphorina citri]